MTEAITNQLAEIIGAVHDSISALRNGTAIRHNAHLLRHERDQAAPGSSEQRYFEEKRKEAEQDLERTDADLFQSLRKLEAMKLILEGKTTEEIREKFAKTDAVLTAFTEKAQQISRAA